jgi:hypothetical protein
VGSVVWLRGRRRTILNNNLFYQILGSPPHALQRCSIDTLR